MALFITRITLQNFLFVIFIFILVRPTFYYYSSTIARFSDLVALLLSLLVVYLAHKRLKLIKKKSVAIISSLFLLYLVLIALSLHVNNFLFQLSVLDLVELARPVILFSAFIFGLIIIRNFNDIKKLFQTILVLGIIHSIIGIVEYFTSLGSIFYILFSVPNLLDQGRAGGIVYSHTEYTAFSTLISLIAIHFYNSTTKLKYLLIFGFIITSSLLSLSKAGLVYVLVYIFFMLTWMFFKAKVKIRLALLFVLVPLILIVFYYSVENFHYFTSGFKALLDYQQTTNLSILNRLHDIENVLNIFTQYDYRALIGSSPLRNYRDVSYIEITFFNMLFRFGIVGLVVYYSILLFPLFLSRKKIYPVYSFLLFGFKVLAIALLIADFTANVSETIKFSFLLFFLYGVLYKIYLISKENNEKSTIINK